MTTEASGGALAGASSTTPSSSTSSPRRRVLYSAVAMTCVAAGFDAAEKAALETLTEILQSCLSEIGRSSRAFSELACRTEPLAGDVLMALVEMGLSLDSLVPFLKLASRTGALNPGTMGSAQTPKILQAGVKRKHPNHILEHFPSFPDPHAYIRTPTHKQPITEYYTVREKVANQKRDVERALTRFMAKTGESQSLFFDDLFPLIACKTHPQPYLTALLSKDQVLDDGNGTISAAASPEGSSVGEAKLQHLRATAAAAAAAHQSIAMNSSAAAITSSAASGASSAALLAPAASTGAKHKLGAAAAAATDAGVKFIENTMELMQQQKKEENEVEAIDNPYLRSIKLPQNPKR